MDLEVKCLWEVLVPTVTPDGRPIHTRFHRVWDKRVRDIAGGLTVHPPSKGQWVAPDGELFAERMIPVKIYCTREQIDRIAELTGEYYKQRAVMYYAVTEKVFIRQFG